MRELAAQHGIDLGPSYAYSDSATDLPMLEAVGHPVAVNPDRGLLRVAREREWEVVRFGREISLRSARPHARDEARPAWGSPASRQGWWCGGGFADPRRADADQRPGRVRRSGPSWRQPPPAR